LKILHITYWYPTKTQAHKGKFIQNHAHATLKANCNVHLLNLSIENASCLFKKECTSFTDEAGMPVTQILVQSRFYKLLHLLLFIQKRWINSVFSDLHSKHQFELLHGHVLYPAAIWTHYLSKKYNIPFIITEHWSKVNQFMNKSLFADEAQSAYQSAKAITCVSDFLKSSVEPYSLTTPIRVIGNVIKSNIFKLKTHPLPENKIVFTAVAHWLAPKRPDLIFESLAQYAVKHPEQNPLLNIVGEGQLLNNLKEKQWPFDVHYLGQINAENLSQVLNKTNYFLHASETETFSVVIAEALATGTPVLASNRGAIPNLVTKTCGMLCENTIESWLEGLESITSAKYSALAIAQSTLKYNEIEIGNQFREIYSNVLKNN
jgi:glycosyltransferase involved in cell wall biosynthesis